MLKYKILNNTLALIIGAVTMFICSCASTPIPVDPKVNSITAGEEAKNYNLALVDSIQDADQIIIKEHSHKVDFLSIIPDLDAAPSYTYAVKELSIGEKVMFLENAKKLKGVAANETSKCLFVSHHTIDFYAQGKLQSSMQVCYKCSEVKWNGSSLNASKDVFEAITPVITGVGMKTSREWDAMAKQRYDEENRTIVPGPKPNPGEVPIAKWAPGQNGKKVINPFTGKLVDVEGIAANTKVRDPNDKDPSHIFKVPAK